MIRPDLVIHDEARLAIGSPRYLLTASGTSQGFAQCLVGVLGSVP